MNRLEILNHILEEGVVSIIRMKEAEKVPHVLNALREGGLSAIEITLVTPDALQLIEAHAGQAGLVIGAGSVLDAASAEKAILAGAKFIVTPISKKEIIEMAHRYDVPIFSGAFTPGEILAATEWGADVIKVFPADSVGMSYLKAVKAPMPHLKLMPTGGVTLSNAGEWIRYGACAVGIGSALTDKRAIAEENYRLLTENASDLLMNIKSARA